MANRWDPAGVARLVAALREADVTYLRFEIAGVGLRLELRRGPEGHLAPIPENGAARDGTSPPTGAAAPQDVVTAPVLGVFYRRPAPDQPPMVEEGQRVEAGQALGLLEVMKTYHEVVVTHPGILIDFLVDDGQYVEYGQPIARLQRENRSGA